MDEYDADTSAELMNNSSPEGASTRVQYMERMDTMSNYLQLDTDYLKTLPGMIKSVVIVLDMLCFITLMLISRTAQFSGTFWSVLVCSTALTISLTLLILYLFHVVDAFQTIPWIVSEMVFCFSWTIFYFMVGSVLALVAMSHNHFGFGFAALFAFGAMATYGFDSFLKFLSWKRNEVAHGGEQTSAFSDTANLSTNRERNEYA